MVKDSLDGMDKMENVNRIFASEFKTKHFIIKCQYNVPFVISNKKDKRIINAYHISVSFILK